MKEYKKEKRKDRKRKIDDIKNDDDNEGPTDEMAAIMGFSDFGSSKKKWEVFVYFYIDEVYYKWII